MVDTKEINRLIDESGLKREYIAQKIGISRQALYLKIQGYNDFTVREAAVLCEILGIKKISEKDRLFFA